MKKAQRNVFRRSAIEQMHRIHRLLENKEYPNSRKLAREFEITVRTLRRDIEFMKTRLTLPIAFNVEQNGDAESTEINAKTQRREDAEKDNHG